MKDLLVLAAYPNEQATQAAALQYFLDNFNILYADQYDSSINVAFLPTTDNSSRTPLVFPSSSHFLYQCWASVDKGR
jgi:hypothetical protein